MSILKNDGRTAECGHVREALSDYLEDGLKERYRLAVEDHLATCSSCRHEEEQLAALLECLHTQIPHREPALDIWAELGPKVAAAMSEERLGVLPRLRLRAGRFFGNVATGAILFTQALAMNTDGVMQRYATHDPFQHAEED